jgi:hypothetical protein
MVMDDRSNTILDMADYRCGYFRLANNIFNPLLYNARVRTDTTSVWVLELQGNFSPPIDYAYEVFHFYRRGYIWPSSVLTSYQRSIPTLSESPYKVIITTDISKSLPLTYRQRTFAWYHAQEPVEQWSPLMRAMKIAGVGYAILDIPLKVFTLRPPPKNKIPWSQSVGGKRMDHSGQDDNLSDMAVSEYDGHQYEDLTCRADPSPNRFQRDIDEKHHGDCFPDMILVTIHTMQ